MADAYRKRTRGEPLAISADEYNRLTEAARANRDSDLTVGGNHAASRPAGAVLCKNATGSARARGECVGITFPLITRAANDAEFQSRAIATTASPAAFQKILGVWAESVGTSAVGWVYITGIVPAKLDIANAGDEWADTPASGYLAKTGMIGQARILFKDSGTGSSDKWGVLELAASECRKLDGKLTTTLARAGTGTMDVRKASASGGLGSAVGSTVPIVDTGKLSATLPTNTTVSAIWHVGEAFAVLEGFDCSAV